MNTFNFTNARLRKLSNQTDKDQEFKDTTQKGLILRLTKSNSKIFRLKAWNKRKRKTEQIVIGSFPTITIPIARDIVSTHIENIAKGIDHAEVLRQEREVQMLDEVFDIWVEDYAKEHNRRWAQDVSRYNLYIQPYLGGMKLSDITPDILIRWRLKILKQKKQRGDGFVTKGNCSTSSHCPIIYLQQQRQTCFKPMF